MFYVPYVPPQPPSPRTRELADLLIRAIEEYQKYHPNVSSAEVRAALQMASVRSSTPVNVRLLAVAGGLVALVLGGVVAFLTASQGAVPAAALPMVGLAVVLVAVLVLMVVLKSRGG